MSRLVHQWFNLLLEREVDLEALARISGNEKEAQHEKIAQLRKSYTKHFHNASQLVYPWIQIGLMLDNNDPVGAWLRYAVTDSDALRSKFKKLVKAAQSALEKAGRDSSSEADARGFVLLAIASLFAPDEFFNQLGHKKADNAD